MFRVWQPREASPRGLSGLHVREPPTTQKSRGFCCLNRLLRARLNLCALGSPPHKVLSVSPVCGWGKGALPGASPEPPLGLLVFSQEVRESGLYPPVEVPTGLWFLVPALAAHASRSNKRTQPKFLRDLLEMQREGDYCDVAVVPVTAQRTGHSRGAVIRASSRQDHHTVAWAVSECSSHLLQAMAQEVFLTLAVPRSHGWWTTTWMWLCTSEYSSMQSS